MNAIFSIKKPMHLSVWGTSVTVTAGSKKTLWNSIADQQNGVHSPL